MITFKKYVEKHFKKDIDVDGAGNKSYPCGKPDWDLDTNLAESI